MSGLPDRSWPDDLAAYKRTPEFTAETVPAALLRRHSTKAGVWARLHLLSGTLVFRDLVAGNEQHLTPGVHPVIYPQAEHAVLPSGSARFLVEFCRRLDDVPEGEASERQAP